MNYEADIRIDENALDIEWLDQPSLFLKYSRHLADARRLVDEIKQTLEITKAELDKDIRDDPDKYGLSKVTEGAILSIILTEKKYANLYSEYLNAKYEADMAEAAVKAFHQRKEALENLVRLYGQEYFAGPRVPRDLQQERKLREKKVDSGVASKLTRNK